MRMGDREGSGPSLGAILAIVGGALAAIGSFLTWIKVTIDFTELGQFISQQTGQPLPPGVLPANQTQSFAGTSGSDGKITLIAGVVAIVAGVVLIAAKSRSARRAAAVLGAIGGLVALALGVYDATRVDTEKDKALDQAQAQFAQLPELRSVIDRAVDAKLGIGIYVVIAGGALALIGGGIGASSPGGAQGAAPMAPPPPMGTTTGGMGGGTTGTGTGSGSGFGEGAGGTMPGSGAPPAPPPAPSPPAPEPPAPGGTEGGMGEPPTAGP
jgi:hypothetical protein